MRLFAIVVLLAGGCARRSEAVATADPATTSPQPTTNVTPAPLSDAGGDVIGGDAAPPREYLPLPPLPEPVVPKSPPKMVPPQKVDEKPPPFAPPSKPVDGEPTGLEGIVTGTETVPKTLGPPKCTNFPADAAVDEASVTLSVDLDAAGKPTNMNVVNESPPGQGFGAAAKECAQKGTYPPGKPKVTIRVRFVR